ncbi:hypothetical protein DMH17_11405 [Raoultella planticola]|nr:hypothetical protein [Raoultella planticola]
MSHSVNLPMYALHPPENQALEAAVREAVARPRHCREFTIVAADGLTFALASAGSAAEPDLRLPAGDAAAGGSDGGLFSLFGARARRIDYRSLLVARKADNARPLADFRGRRAICNSPDSQSGYNVLLKMVAPLAHEGRFSGVNFSGSRQSLLGFPAGAGDIAAIDCVSWAAAGAP